jgi:hypothetical protein
MKEYGFSFLEGPAGRGSGGPFASAAYVQSDRKLEFSFRFLLGLVTYQFGEARIDHESYMRAVLGENRGNRYPGFSDEPLAAFQDLAFDLRNFAKAFLKGDSAQFARYAIEAEEWKRIPGIARLP